MTGKERRAVGTLLDLYDKAIAQIEGLAAVCDLASTKASLTEEDCQALRQGATLANTASRELSGAASHARATFGIPKNS